VTTVEAAGVRAPAWRGGFGRLWSAAVVSRFGDALRTAALPLLAVRLTDDPLVIASVTACGYLPWLLFGLLGGAVADRVDQRRAMWAVDTVRGGLVACFALAVGLGHATIGLLIALAFALTTLQTLFDNASTALLPSLVDKETLGSANARLMTGQQFAGGFLAGPFVPLLLTLGAAAPFAADAATYLLAAALVASLRIRAPEREPRPAGSTLRAEVAEGVRTLWHDRALRAVCVATLLCNIGMGALIATLVLHVTGWLHAGNAGFAAAMTAYSAGSLAGGVPAQWIARRIRPDGGPGTPRHRPPPGCTPRGDGAARSDGHGVERQPGHADAAAQPGGHGGPRQLRVPYGLHLRGPARRPARRHRGGGLRAERARAVRGRPLRARRHLADTRASGGRICC
jgi:MFS family permease